MLNYTREEKRYFENLLNKCVKFKYYNVIYYVTNKNIIRQLKYNKLLKNNNIIINLNDVSFDENIILRIDTSNKNIIVNDYKIWQYIDSRHFCAVESIIFDILNDILKFNKKYQKYKIETNIINTFTLSKYLNLNAIKIKNGI